MRAGPWLLVARAKWDRQTRRTCVCTRSEHGQRYKCFTPGRRLEGYRYRPVGASARRPKYRTFNVHQNGGRGRQSCRPLLLCARAGVAACVRRDGGVRACLSCAPVRTVHASGWCRSACSCTLALPTCLLHACFMLAPTRVRLVHHTHATCPTARPPDSNRTIAGTNAADGPGLRPNLTLRVPQSVARWPFSLDERYWRTGRWAHAWRFAGRRPHIAKLADGVVLNRRVRCLSEVQPREVLVRSATRTSRAHWS